jgi:5-formyltetrahydrofolate cyclo-ligase
LSVFKGKTVGLVYSDFLVQKLPTNEYDIKIQKIITEGGALDFTNE